MHVAQEMWRQGAGEDAINPAVRVDRASLVLAFGAPDLVRAPETWERLRARWPNAALVTASTAGEICGTRVLDGSIVATALAFDTTRIRCARVDLGEASSSHAIGGLLADRLIGEGLRHVFVLSEGLKVNGSALVRGLSERLPDGVSLTGGLSGDGARFERTYVCLDGFTESPGVVGI